MWMSGESLEGGGRVCVHLEDLSVVWTSQVHFKIPTEAPHNKQFSIIRVVCLVKPGHDHLIYDVKQDSIVSVIMSPAKSDRGHELVNKLWVHRFFQAQEGLPSVELEHFKTPELLLVEEIQADFSGWRAVALLEGGFKASFRYGSIEQLDLSDSRPSGLSLF
ncbi:uncharacterized protein G2W53_041269 [Senna tora]|uniref:Uncharacterized protein n=1 Tax=Senna tora TaxID=362788 RepID=A0A834VXT9_9FABA|nr:uncharacterized protein G2W53_041269 [Senna tora]